MIRGAAPAEAVFFLNILRVQSLRSGSGRLEVPVSASHSLYAHFEHVRGVPTPEGGASFFKLGVLDRLIDRLLAEGQPLPVAGGPGLAPGTGLRVDLTV